MLWHPRNGLPPPQFSEPIEVFLIENAPSKKEGYPLHENIRLLNLGDPNFAKEFPDLRSSHSFVPQKMRIDYLKLAKCLQDNQIDILIFNTLSNPLCFLYACLIVKIPCLFWSHNSLGLFRHRKDKYVNYKLQGLAAYATGIITISQREKNLWATLQIDPRKILYIPNMIVTPQTHQYDPRNHNVVAIGRQSPVKGFDHLVKIWNVLMQKKRNQTWHLTIIGDEDGDDEYSAILKKTAQNIKNLKLQPTTPDIASVYKNTGIFCLTSLSETFGLVLAEAQSYGIPAVSFNCPVGPADIIANNKSGFLVPLRNDEAFEQALQKLMDNSDLRKAFSQAAEKQAKRFFDDRIIPLWINMIMSLQRLKEYNTVESFFSRGNEKQRSVHVVEQGDYLSIRKRAIDIYPSFQGLRFLLEKENLIDANMISKGIWEPRQLHYFVHLIKDLSQRVSYNDFIFLDIGAHWGLYSFVALKTDCFHKIIAFEPERTNFAQFQANLFLNKACGKIDAIQKAVSNKKGKSFIQDALAIPKNRRMARFRPQVEDAQSYEVEAVTIDSMMKEKNKYFLIKIDVEGCEQAVLDGMKKLLKNNNVVMQIEIWAGRDGQIYKDIRQSPLYKKLVAAGMSLIRIIAPDYYFTNIKNYPEHS